MASIQQGPNGPVLVLKESALQQKGKDAQQNNIAAAKLVAELVKSSLGPRGLDKMLVDSLGDVTITNDGATILNDHFCCWVLNINFFENSCTIICNCNVA